MFYLLALFVFLFGIGAFLFAPWVPTKPKDVDRIFDLVAPSPEDVFYELGCGDGRLTLYFAEKGIRSRGFEISAFLFLYCLLQKWRKNARSADFIFWDFFRASLKEATIVYLFGTDKTINDSPRLREKLQNELKPGTKVVSYLFRVDWLKLVTSHKDPEGMSIYVYKM